MLGWLIFLGIPLVLFIYVISLFNGLVGRRNAVKNGFSQIDVQLQRRHDLIPNLVEAAKAYMSHEQQTLERVISARNAAVTAQQNLHRQSEINPQLLEQLLQAEHKLSQSLAQFTAVMEQYPDLKADGVVKELMEELNTTENRVSFSRQAYNDAVMLYNNACETFPGNFVAGVFSFKTMKQLALDDAKTVRQSVRVDF